MSSSINNIVKLVANHKFEVPSSLRTSMKILPLHAIKKKIPNFICMWQEQAVVQDRKNCPKKTLFRIMIIYI